MEFIQQNILLVGLSVVSGILTIVSFLSGTSGRSSLSPNQATQLINREDATVIDVRETNEYAGGHLPESRCIPLGQIESRVEELTRFKASPLIVVCQTGARSASAVKQLEKHGFENIHNLEGGINAWRDAGLPLKKGTKK